jgi:hypothetical protein
MIFFGFTRHVCWNAILTSCIFIPSKAFAAHNYQGRDYAYERIIHISFGGMVKC